MPLGTAFRTLVPKSGPPLTAPTGLAVAVLSATSLRLTWTNASPTDQVRVYRDSALVTTLAAGTTTWDNTGLAQGTAYSYFLRHYRNSVESANSNTASATTTITPVTSLASSIPSDNQASFTWANPDNVMPIEFWWCQTGVGDWRLVNLAAGTTSYVLNGLTRCVNYDIVVRRKKNAVQADASLSAVRPRLYVSGGYSQQSGGYEYHWMHDQDMWLTLQNSGRLSYYGFGRGGTAGSGAWSGEASTGGGGAASGSLFYAGDTLEPAGTYYVQCGTPGNDGTRYRNEYASNGGWGGGGDYYGGGNGGGNNNAGGGAGYRGGGGNNSGGGGGAGCNGGGGNAGVLGGDGGPSGYISIFGTICPGGNGGRGKGTEGQNAGYWGGGGHGAYPDQYGGSGLNGGYVCWFPI